MTPSLDAVHQSQGSTESWPGLLHIPVTRTEADRVLEMDTGTGGRKTRVTKPEFGRTGLSRPFLSYLQTIPAVVMLLSQVLLISVVFLPDIRTLLPWHCTLRENKMKTGHFLLLKVQGDRKPWSSVTGAPQL